MLLLAASTSFGQQLETKVQAWADELMPAIEAATGRMFASKPTIGLYSRTAAREELIALGIPADHAERAERALGIYVPAASRILLIDQAIRAFTNTNRLPHERSHELVRCVLAHELVHALQHQVNPQARADEDPVLSGLREGHADLIAARVCGPGADLLDASQGLEMRASQSPENPIAFAYGLSERFLAVLTELSGPESAWLAQSTHVPDRALVERVGATGAASGWADPAPLDAVLARFEDTKAWTHEGGSVRPSTLSWALAADTEAIGIEAEGGLYAAALAPRKMLAAFVFLLPNDEVGPSWIRGRRSAYGNLDGFAFLPAPEASLTLLRAPAIGSLSGLGRGASLSVQLEFAGKRPYVEAWMARGRRLFGVFDSTPRTSLARTKDLMAALAELPFTEAPAPLLDVDRDALARWGKP